MKHKQNILFQPNETRR